MPEELLARVDPDRISSIMVGVYLHKDPRNVLRSDPDDPSVLADETAVWNWAVDEVARIVAQGGVPDFLEWFG